METQDIVILINGVALPTPSTYEVEYSDMDADSIRGISDGVLQRNRIRANVQKIYISYLLKNPEDISKVYKMISPATFEVEVWEDVEGERVTKTMYAGPKKHAYVRTQSGLKGQGVQFSLIEV